MQNFVNKEARFQLYQGEKEISNRAYNLIIGATLLYGFIINAIMVTQFADLFSGINYIALLIGYFVCIIIGAALTRSKNPGVSFIGFNFIVVPIGALLTCILPYYQSSIVLNAIVITGIITLLMMVAGSIFPSLFLSIGRTLFIALLAVILVEVASTFIFHQHYQIFDYIVVVIFSLYIGYDWARANRYKRTVDNAIDSATDLYMDIINIFIRILSILGRR